ncbi:uncharacterized protein BO66DRAFT_443006 [Aspergillus aculeatinus CBS 121060]|uniref:Uncharacterized protein n=1 Tax=Aspergillus aculeatinus CBS 121060 TaxID=1448322 RepID=A0ACD1GVT4_9EURO|nr:hypothetical protein BO66DRAFT_443006 [Aspergillus aculeatinus CBS 121060]RAH65469.1 hypothetical protein BO66DRAFT_443006 [Aspergillus aculeatinus CBS 121060]
MDCLPPELILSIGQLIEKHTLCSLVRCCQRLYDVLQPLFYSEIRLIPPLSDSYVSLVMRLWRCPDLASLVRRAEIHLPIIRHPRRQYQLDEKKVPELQEFIQDVQNEMFDLKDKRRSVWWGTKLRSSDWCFWLGVLLVRLTRLESIEFVGLYNNSAICDLLYRAGKQQRPFDETSPYPLLRHISVRDCEQGFDLEEVLTPFFYFPAVETVDVSQLWEGRGRDDPLEWRREASCARCPVKRIDIRSLKHSRGTLTWLADCTELEHISVRIACIFVGYPEIRYGVPFNPSRFVRALLPFRKTLKSLHIEYDQVYHALLNAPGPIELYYEDIYWLTEDEQNLNHCNAPVDSMRDFEVLEEVTLRHANLLPAVDGASARGILADRLPRSLRRLCVLNIVETRYADLLVELTTLVTTARDAFPNLTQIQLPRNTVDEMSFTPFQQDCTNAGVSFEYF